MNFDALVVAVLLSAWAICAGLAWLATAAARRGRDAFLTLPAALLCGWAAALLLPALGRDDGLAFALSFPMAALGGLAGVFAVLGLRAKMKGGGSDPASPPSLQDSTPDD